MHRFRPLLFAALMLPLCSCADTEWPQWISGEPTHEEINAYKGPIPMPNPDAEGKPWPNLADVPKRPKIILSQEKTDTLVTEMKEKNAEGLREIEAYNENTKAVVTSPPVKKPPAKKPVKKKHKKKAKPHASTSATSHATSGSK